MKRKFLKLIASCLCMALACVGVASCVGESKLKNWLEDLIGKDSSSSNDDVTSNDSADTPTDDNSSDEPDDSSSGESDELDDNSSTDDSSSDEPDEPDEPVYNDFAYFDGEVLETYEGDAVTLPHYKIVCDVGEEFRLRVDGAEIDAVTPIALSNSIATCDTRGNVTALSVGIASYVLNIEGANYSTTIIVAEKESETDFAYYDGEGEYLLEDDIYINPVTASVSVGATFRVKAVEESGNTLTYTLFGNSEGITVDERGNVTAVSAGVGMFSVSGASSAKLITITVYGDEHEHTETTIAAVAATCTTAGSTAGVKCSECGEILTAPVEIPATGHTTTAFVSYREATCTTAGTTTGVKCSVCNEILTEPVELPATGHTEVTDAAVAATCTTTGLTEGKHCSVCGTVITAQTTIPATGHTEVTDVAVAATCTTTGLTEGKHCSVCGTVITAQEVIPAGHYDEDVDGLCDGCNENILTGGFTEVAVEVGELVANNWYRIYRGEYYNSNTLSLSDNYYGSFFCSEDYPDAFLFASGPLWRANMHVVETEEYIDLFLGVGTYMLTRSNDSTGSLCGYKITIDGTTTIGSMNNESAVYRLVGSVDPHTDADGNGICDVCKDGTEVAEAGELVTDNVYRIYFDELGASAITTMSLSAFDAATYFSLDSTRSATAYLWWSGDSGPLYYLEGMIVVKTDTYIQFSIQAGTYRILKSDGTDTGDTVTIDETTTISSISGIVRRIVVADDHNCDIVTRQSIAATCTTNGLSSSKICSLCFTVYEGAEVISATGHTDADGDGICDVCKDGAVIVSEGELIAGNTYRFYTEDTSPIVKFSWSDSDTYFYIAGEKNYVWWSGYSGPYGYLEGLTVVKTDDYFQVTFLPGTYRILKSDGTDTGDTVTIDETTTISSIYNSTVYRIPNA